MIYCTKKYILFIVIHVFNPFIINVELLLFLIPAFVVSYHFSSLFQNFPEEGYLENLLWGES